MPKAIGSIMKLGSRTALPFGIAVVMWFSHLDMATAVAAQQANAPTAAQIAAEDARDRDLRVRAQAARLEAIAGELARIQPVGAARPSTAEVLAGRGDAEPSALASRVIAAIDALDEFEDELEADWDAESEAMVDAGIPAEVIARRAPLLAEIQDRARTFRALVTPLRDARARGAMNDIGASLAQLSDFFSTQTNARAWRAIDKAALPMSFAEAADTPAPHEPTAGDGVAGAGDPPGADELAETLDAPFTPSIRAVAQSLDGQPVAIRNWVYDHVEFHPSFGSVQGADTTLLARRGNAFDIASLTIAMLRVSGVPARYARSVVEIPIAQAQNWLGNLATPQMAIELMQKGGIPAASVISGGRIVAVRFEHVWVEAWVDFVPSRGAINRVPDQWVPFDVAFKQFDYTAPYPWLQTTLVQRQDIVREFAKDIEVDNTGGITGFDFDSMNRSIGGLAQQLAEQMTAADPNATTEQFYERHTIRPIDSLILAGSLPYPLRSATVARFAEVTPALRQTAEIKFYATASDLGNDSPSGTMSVPLARLGTRRFGIDYAPATPADASTLSIYAASNAASLSLGQINVVPRVVLGDEVLWQAGATRMGVMHYWHVDIRDANGRRTTTEAYQFAAGSTIALIPDLAGVSLDRVERESDGLPDAAYLPTRDALYYGGLLYWATADHLRDQAGRSAGGVVVRLPSLGAFAAPYQVSYFFGVPRSGSIKGRVTDVKVSRIGMVVLHAEDREQLALHLGAVGSAPEGATWALLGGTGRQSLGMSAATALKLAIDNGQRLFQINRENLPAALGQLGLSAFAEAEIARSVNAGLVVVAHERELRQGDWSGSGYVVFDPSTGSSLQRVEGGYAGGIELDCIVTAVMLAYMCQTKILARAKRFLMSLGVRAIPRALALAAIVALQTPLGRLAGIVVGIIASVVTTVCIAYAAYEVGMWLRGIIDGWETLTSEELAELGISGLNNIACSYLPWCMRGMGGMLFGFGAGFFSGGDESDPGIEDERGAGGPLVGNPTAIGTGSKWQTEVDYEGEGAFPLRFERVYASAVPNVGSFIGAKWTATYFQRLRLPPSIDGSPFPTDQRPRAVLAFRPDGGWAQYDWRDSAYVGESNVPGRLERLTSGASTVAWVLHTPQDTAERYDANGRLLSITHRSGLAHTLSYDSLGRPERVTHTFGRTLGFTYDGDSGYLATVTDPASREIRFAHDDIGNLTMVRHADLTTRQYHYEDITQRFHLTGLTDERGIRVSSWQYDHLGRVLVGERAGGTERYAFRYEGDRTYVTDPLGTTRTYTFETRFQRKYLRSVTEPCGSCGSGSVAETTYDSRGLISSRKDFEGRETRYVRNARGLIETLTEAYGTPLARSTRTAWHPIWHLPTEIREPIEGGTRVTTYIYDDRGNPDAVSISARGTERVTDYTVDTHGQLTALDGPRTDVNDAQSWNYDPVTGDRTRMTDAAGHVTQYATYDADGRLTRRIDANNLITDYLYDARGRLTHITVRSQPADLGETTVFTWNPAGWIERITFADASSVAYGRDDAGRQVRVEEGGGRHVVYTPNALGQRIKEETFEADGTLAEVVERRVDALGRLEAVFGTDEAEATHYTYDASGNEKTVTDALGHVTTQHYDGLNRLRQTDVLDAADPDHATIAYGYDAQDNLATVNDPRQRVTRYAYTGFDELETLTSPDTGVTAHRYDPAGNLRVRTDSRGQRMVANHDALGRLVEARHGLALTGDPEALALVEETLGFHYDEPSGGDGAKGRLTHFTDGAGSTGLVYDRHGRLIERTQALGAGAADHTKRMGHRYDAAGRLDERTLPSGAVIGYAYGTDGRVLTITVNGVVIVREVEMQPFGEVRTWTLPSGARFRRTVDADGRVDSVTLGAITREFAYDAADRLTGLLDTTTPGSGTPTGPASPNWTFAYDGQDRLSGAANAATTGIHAQLAIGWAYDATGNREAETRNGAPTLYSTDPASNRLMAVGGTARSYDAAGNTASDGTYAYTYGARNRLTEARLSGSGAIVARYATNAFGERVCKATGGGQCPRGPGYGTPNAGSGPFTQYFYDDSGHLVGEYDASGAPVAEHVWLDDTPIAVLKPASFTASHGGLAAGGVAVFLVQPDHLDTPRVVLNASGQPVWRWDSTPFGDTPANESPTGAAPFAYALRFPGQQFDAETQSHYNYFRDYEPDTGRYLQSDQIGLAGGLTTFQYTIAGPLNQSDPYGLASRIRQRGDCRVIGTPQRTGPGHWFSSARWALCQINAGATTVWFHSAMKTICGEGNDFRKPDAAAKFPDGGFTLCEACSGKGKKRQTRESQEDKIRSMRRDNGLPPSENDEVIP